MAERPPRVETRENRIREVPCASDLSPESERAIEHARFLAERYRAAPIPAAPMQMSFGEYLAEIGLTCMSIPFATSGLAIAHRA